MIALVALVRCGGGEEEGSPEPEPNEGSNTPGKTVKGITDPFVRDALAKKFNKPTNAFV